MVKTYDPAAVQLSVAGNLIGGFADGSMIRVERDEDAFTKMVGATGEVARARNRNRSGAVTITLMQTSMSNDALSALAKADELTGTGVGVLMLKDLNGNTIVMAPNAWVKKLPAVGFGKELESREWVIDCDYLDEVVGGTLI